VGGEQRKFRKRNSANAGVVKGIFKKDKGGKQEGAKRVRQRGFNKKGFGKGGFRRGGGEDQSGGNRMGAKANLGYTVLKNRKRRNRVWESWIGKSKFSSRGGGF
jgi:hypothetical protein